MQIRTPTLSKLKRELELCLAQPMQAWGEEGGSHLNTQDYAAASPEESVGFSSQQGEKDELNLKHVMEAIHRYQTDLNMQIVKWYKKTK